MKSLKMTSSKLISAKLISAKSKSPILFIVATLLTAQASAEGVRGDLSHHRLFDDLRVELQKSHAKQNKRQVDQQRTNKPTVSKLVVNKQVVNKRVVKKQVVNKRVVSKAHNKGQSSYNSSYSSQHKNKHTNKNYGTKRWETVSAFRGRSGKVVTRQIQVGEEVRALSIAGTKRGMVVRRAKALLGNGRWIRLEGLEGHVTHGEQVSHRLHNPRHIRRVLLDIAPDRDKRGYGELQIKPA